MQHAGLVTTVSKKPRKVQGFCPCGWKGTVFEGPNTSEGSQDRAVKSAKVEAQAHSKSAREAQ